MLCNAVFLLYFQEDEHVWAKLSQKWNYSCF